MLSYFCDEEQIILNSMGAIMKTPTHMQTQTHMQTDTQRD